MTTPYDAEWLEYDDDRRDAMNDDNAPDDFDMPDFGNQEGFAQMGKMGLTIYRSVIRDGGSETEAFSITSAFFAGFTKAFRSDDNE